MDESLKNMQKNMPKEYENKTPGFLTYDLLKSVSLEIDELISKVEGVEKKIDPRNMTIEELEVEAKTRRGIIRKKATNAKVILNLTGQGIINIGDLFSTKSNIQFQSLETKVIDGNNRIEAQCKQLGSIGVVDALSITQFPITLQGINTVINNETSYDGFNSESHESLLERYLDDVQNPVTSNNVYHFEKWAREVAGVGKAKIFPTWNGNNSVKVVIIDDNMLPSSSELVAKTQKYIDPIEPQKWGKGYGKSALGSYCTVVSASQKLINISATIVKSNNYTLENIKLKIENFITQYLKTVAFDEQLNYISHSKIVSLIISVEGVLDVTNVTVNDSISSNVM
ncbi:MAG: baseplate J/gp47 family protein, partial [Psychrilyobacter sp.]|uniref:baseplate J/gp47 family protein n=1 Tax=Psychrilyobacter sp. TaxID=2586924 RepID=UPI003C73ABFC